MENNRFIGDYIGTIEEFMPGEGTYAEDGKIYASNIGKMVLDRENHIARIDGKFPPELKVRSIVFGDVLNIKKNVVTVIVRKIQGFSREFEIKSAIYVSNISNSYVEKPEDLFGIGDIVKAKVIKIMPGIVDLSTKGNLGVVKAFCKRCRYPLIKSENYGEKLICPVCNHREDRKISEDYGNVSEI